MTSKAPHFLWVTDPWDTLDHPRETTLRLMEESLTLGFQNSWCDVRSVRWAEGKVLVDARAVEGIFPGRGSEAFRLSPPHATTPDHFTSIQYRPDPPVDLGYIHPLQLLVLGTEGKKHVEIVNSPATLLLLNEKLEGGHLGDLFPPTVVAASWDPLAHFGKAEGRTVLKPLNQAGTRGIELLDWRTPEAAEHAKTAITQATQQFTRPVQLQRYFEAIERDGEIRLWFLNGHVLAAVRKKPKQGEFRVNMDQGGTLALVELDADAKRTAARIGKRLRALEVRLAAVDLIEGFVTDFNVTSPGLLVQMEGLLGENLAKAIVESLVHRFPTA